MDSESKNTLQFQHFRLNRARGMPASEFSLELVRAMHFAPNQTAAAAAAAIDDVHSSTGAKYLRFRGNLGMQSPFASILHGNGLWINAAFSRLDVSVGKKLSCH